MIRWDKEPRSKFEATWLCKVESTLHKTCATLMDSYCEFSSIKDIKSQGQLSSHTFIIGGNIWNLEHNESIFVFVHKTWTNQIARCAKWIVWHNVLVYTIFDYMHITLVKDFSSQPWLCNTMVRALKNI